MMKYKAEVQTVGDKKYYSNALRFNTEGEADAYARDLASRWLAVETYRIVEDKEDED